MSSSAFKPHKPPGAPPSSSGSRVPTLPNALPKVPIPNGTSGGAQSARRPSREVNGTGSKRQSDSGPSGSQSARAPPVTASGDAIGMDGAEAAIKYDSVLTPFERSEIVEFDDVFYAGQNCSNKIKAPVPSGINFGYDDDRGDYTIVAKDHIAYRYEVLSVLGRGSFGQVVKCFDHKANAPVALKIIRNKKRFHQQAQVEVKVLTHLRDRDPEGRYGIIKMTEAFQFRCHVCLTYELLSMNLYEYMKMNRFYPMPLTVVKKIGASLLISLAFMWRENIIHCDLKPENILLRQPNRTGVKVIDLGSACFENERIYTYIQSRFYRAPEIILGIGYTRRIDLWSYACVLCELASGYPLFPGESETEQLACIMEVMGVPPKYLIDASNKKSNFFDTTSDGNYAPRLVPNSRKKIRQPNTKTLEAFLGLEPTDPFIDFIQMFLRWDPEERPQPEAAMRHPWICDAYVGITPKPNVSKRRKDKSGATTTASDVVSATSSSASALNPPPSSSSGTNGTVTKSAAVPHLPNIHAKGAPNPRHTNM